MSRKIIAVVDDMIFASRIRAVAEAVGVEISFPRTLDAFEQKIGEDKPDLVLVDLHNQRIDPTVVVATLKNQESTRETPTLGFFSHVQTELQQKAIAAGFTKVVPRSFFARELPNILQGEDLT
jgi:CheY-like chemotaxis protein